MKRIPLTNGGHAIVDDEDYMWLCRWTWHRRDERRGGKRYASYAFMDMWFSNCKYVKRILMHRFIMKFPNLGIDHINRNGLDNRKSNLRVANQTTNIINSKRPTHNTSGHKGVYYHKYGKKWNTYITINKKRISLGLYEDIEDAIRARHLAEDKYFSELETSKH